MVSGSASLYFSYHRLTGADIVDKVIVGTAQWSELFAKHDFFFKYRYYLQITASTGDEDLQIKWYFHFNDPMSPCSYLAGQAPWNQGFGN
jgi:poly(A) polymerase Pap1